MASNSSWHNFKNSTTGRTIAFDLIQSIESHINAPYIAIPELFSALLEKSNFDTNGIHDRINANRLESAYKLKAILDSMVI